MGCELLEFFGVFNLTSISGNCASEFESLVNTSIVSIEDLLVVVEFFSKLVQHGFDGLRASSSKGIVAHHDGFGIKDSLEVFFGSINLVSVHDVVIASIEVSEVFFVARELADQATHDVMGFTERDIVLEDQVVSQFSRSRKVLKGQVSHAVKVEGSGLNESRDNFNCAVDDAQAFDQDFFVFVEISIVSRGKSLHQSKCSNKKSVDSASTTTE